MSDDHDARLLRRIDDAFDHELPPIPADLTTLARDAFTWRRPDLQLAELLFDSASDELVGVRGTSTERRSFRYGAGEHTVRVHLTESTLIVMVDPPMSLACRVERDDGTAELRTDELGELAVDAPELPFRIEIDLPGGAFVTPWITG